MVEIYPYQQFGELYQFTTAQNIAVTVHAPLDGRWFPNNPEIAGVHSFLIKTNKPSAGLDVRLRNTVLDILTNFLNENDAIIVYYCDPFDGKGYKRYLKFNRWFGLIDDLSIEKQDRRVIVKDLKIDESDHLIKSELTVYASILLRKTHPDYDAAISLFHSGGLDKTGKL
ncbi:DUF6169 family protein [Dyadobacter sp. BHUBP1]|uniref:DUF6169 family protein n=1 Tax=Dyadobacter sp. BHUBP1 TaxID=3424178 RepID=UPI003D34543B